MILRVVDIGSNSIKATGFQTDRSACKVIWKRKLDLSLGQEAFSSRHSLPIARVEEIARFMDELPISWRGTPAAATYVVATSAVRSTGNGQEFAHSLEQRTGYPVRILSGEEEAYLIHLGAMGQIHPLENETLVSLHVGGGSAEIAWSRGRRIETRRSYELGAVRLFRESGAGSAGYSMEAMQAIRLAASKVLHAEPASHPDLASARALGCSSNIRTLGRMAQRMRSGPFQKALPEITRGSLSDIALVCANRTPEQIDSLFEIGRDRACIILPALVVLDAMMSHLGLQRVEPSQAGLRDGVARHVMTLGHLDLSFSQELAWGRD